MSDNQEVYTPSSGRLNVQSVQEQQVDTQQESVRELRASTTLSLSDLTKTFTPRQIMLALGDTMYETAQRQLDNAGEDAIKRQLAYLALAQADRMRNLSAQF